MSSQFSLGIDLGTSNSAIAITDLGTDATELVEVTQVVGPNQVGEKPTLPSALYGGTARAIGIRRTSALSKMRPIRSPPGSTPTCTARKVTHLTLATGIGAPGSL